MNVADIIVTFSIILAIVTVFLSVAMFFVVEEPHNMTAGAALFIGAFVIVGTGIMIGNYLYNRAEKQAAL